MGNKPVRERKETSKLKLDLPKSKSGSESPQSAVNSRNSVDGRSSGSGLESNGTSPAQAIRPSTTSSTLPDLEPAGEFGSPVTTPSVLTYSSSSSASSSSTLSNHKERPLSPLSALSPEHMTAKSQSAFTTPNPTPPPRSHWPWANQITPYLYLGGMQAAKDYDGLVSVGVTHILNVADDVANFYPQKFVYKNLNVKDFGADEGISRVFKEAFEFINKIRQSPEQKVLVHCFAGQNRSVTVTVAVLMMLHRASLKEMFSLVRSKRPAACPFPDNREQLIEFEKTFLQQQTMTMDDFVYKHPLSIERTSRETYFARTTASAQSSTPSDDIGRLPGLYDTNTSSPSPDHHTSHHDDDDYHHSSIPMEDADITGTPTNSSSSGLTLNSSGGSGSSNTPPLLHTSPHGSSFRNLNLSLVRGTTFSGEARRIIRLPSYSSSKNSIVGDDGLPSSQPHSGRHSRHGSASGEQSPTTASPRPSISVQLDKEILSPTVPAYLLNSPVLIMNFSKDKDNLDNSGHSSHHMNSGSSMSISQSLGSSPSENIVTS